MMMTVLSVRTMKKKNATFPLALTSVKRGRQVGADLVWTWLTADAAAAVETH